jgi:ERCC4-type nuclease
MDDRWQADSPRGNTASAASQRAAVARICLTCRTPRSHTHGCLRNRPFPRYWNNVPPQPAARRSDVSIAVEVDHRESTGHVLPVLQNCSGLNVTLNHLPLGDYLVDGRFLFERKTMSDLVVSIIAGRLFDQAVRLARAPVRAAMILEGTSRDLAESGMHWESIQGALVTLTFFCGIPLLRTRTAEETVQTMLFAARQGRSVALGALPRGGYRPRSKRARQLFILQGLPGVGPRRAQRLLERFGSVEAVIKARMEDLGVISGIGERTARQIRWAVEEPSGGYHTGKDSVRPRLVIETTRAALPGLG